MSRPDDSQGSLFGGDDHDAHDDLDSLASDLHEGIERLTAAAHQGQRQEDGLFLPEKEIHWLVENIVDGPDVEFAVGFLSTLTELGWQGGAEAKTRLTAKLASDKDLSFQQVLGVTESLDCMEDLEPALLAAAARDGVLLPDAFENDRDINWEVVEPTVRRRLLETHFAQAAVEVPGPGFGGPEAQYRLPYWMKHVVPAEFPDADERWLWFLDQLQEQFVETT